MKNLLNYNIKGQGFPVVMVHGFMGNQKMWNDYSEILSIKNQVITIDLPGHGKSKIYNSIHTMDFMAKKIIEILDELSIKKAVFIGHSMGGYIIMSLLKNHENYIEKFCLFFSSPFGDSIQKEEIRMKAIELIKQNKEDFIRISIPNSFDSNNLDNLKTEIEFTINQALETSSEGIISAILGLKNREDSTDIFNNTNIKSLTINGLYDNAVDINMIKEKLNFNDYNKIHKILPIGHMGHLEAKEECLNLILKFIEE